MRRNTYLCILCVTGVLLGGCGSPEAYEISQEQVLASTDETDEDYEEWVKDQDETETSIQEDVIPIDPEYTFEFENMEASDFGGFFLKDYESRTEWYPLAEGTEWENQAVHISGAENGAVIYIVAGVHGDEEAAWQAGKLLQKISIKAGNLYILSPANCWGARKDPKSRYVISHEDLNRSFPGNPEGNAAERIADAIYKDIQDKSPDFVLDLHEARPVQEEYDFLGNSLIFTDMAENMEILMDMVSETEAGTLCSEPFGLYGPGPDGSVNAEVSRGLKIPVITIETFRGYSMETRITDHMDLVQYVLQEFGMVD